VAIISKKTDTGLFIEHSSDIVVLLNEIGSVTYVSPSITHIMRYTPEEIVGSHARALVHADDLDIMERALEEIGRSPGKSLHSNYRLYCNDGSWRWFEGNVTNLLDVPGIGAVLATFHDITAQKLAPHSHWSHMQNAEHFVQFCETDAFLIHSLSEFIGTGLREGDACIVLATKSHRESLEERLQEDGLEVTTAYAQGQYIAMDAAELLAKLMVNGLPEPGRFAGVMESVIGQVAQGHRNVRIFGELVALLWAEGNRRAAIRLEELWNELGKTHSFTLFCAYPMEGFGRGVYEAEFTEICQQHGQVIPAESYTALESPSERLRAISLLQQRANSLETEKEENRRLEAKFQQLFDSNLIGVFVSDFDGTFLDANNAFLDILGYTREELLAGIIHRDTLTPAEFRSLSQNAVKALQETGSSGTYEKEYLHKSGKRIPVLVAVTRIEQTDTCIGFVLDITERKELDQRKDEFISMASHELKTPVTSLKGFLNLLQRRLKTQEDEKALHYLMRMDAQVHKLIKLINDLLDLSKMQTGQLAYREEYFAMDALVQEVVENVQETTQIHSLLLEGQTGAEVFGDRDRIGQVLINLLNNAIKYSPQANRVLVRIAKEEQAISVSVQDFGIGIADEHQHKIFERFYQVTDAAEKTYPGLGIGLYISCEIIKRHGGRLWVESQKGAGSTFHFSLPLL
jgi:PAS domain S-box-containing protein